MIETFAVLSIAMLCAGVGNIFLSKGMGEVGEIQGYRPATLLKFFGRAVTNGYVVIGVIISIGYFALWLVVLSWADLSWALPVNAVEYIMVALLAMIFLKEKIDKCRWIGIGLITLGVFLMMESW